MKRQRYKIDYIKHTFGPGETISAVIRYCNKNEALNGQIFDQLVVAFNSVNGFEVPKMGKEYKIPILK